MGHLRDVLAEKEQDIAALRARLRASEELRGGALGRLERLETQLSAGAGAAAAACAAAASPDEAEAARAQLNCRLEALERFVAQGLPADANGAPAREPPPAAQAPSATELERRLAAVERGVRGLAGGGGGEAAGEAAQQLLATQRLVEQLREQLSVSNAGRAALAGEAERWQAEAEAQRREVAALRERLAAAEREAGPLRERLAAAEREAAPAAAVAREAEGLRVRLAEAVSQAGLLASQLAARESDVVRLERRLAELEGREEFGTASVGSSRRPEACGTSAADAVATALGTAPPTRLLDANRLLDETWRCGNLEVPYNLAVPDGQDRASDAEWWQRHAFGTEPPQARQGSAVHAHGPDGLASTTQVHDVISMWPRRDAASATKAPPGTSTLGTPLAGQRTPPPPAAQQGNAVEPLGLGSRARSPTSRAAQQQPYGTLGAGTDVLGGGQTSARLTSVASASELPKLRDPSPQQARHALAASPVQGGTAAVLARSQSVPVHVRRPGAATPAVGSTPSVSLARWAASPVPGHEGGRPLGAGGGGNAGTPGPAFGGGTPAHSPPAQALGGGGGLLLQGGGAGGLPLAVTARW